MMRKIVVLLMLAGIAGCETHAALPQASVTFEHQRLVHAPITSTWQAAVATAERHGIIRVSDQSSGLLTFIYKDGPRRVYCNFLLHAGPSADTTLLTVNIFDQQNQKIPDAALQLLPELQGRAESLRGAAP